MPAQDASFAGAACAFGVFDGVHEGHKFIIGRARAQADELGARTVIITFDRDPSELFCPAAQDKLMSNEERLDALAATGVDEVAIISFTPEVAALLPDAFLDALFAGGAPASLSVGEDFRFGAEASGTVSDLAAWGRAHGMAVDAVPLLEAEGCPVTSTRIRHLLGEGAVEGAAHLLGRPYAVTGEVVSGRHAGREMGICTANLKVDTVRIVPADGVYAAWAVVEGKRYQAAVSVGVPVTFDDATESTIEAHLLDFEGDIYGKQLTLQFVERLRPMIKFDSPQDLLVQIQEDVTRTRTILA